ncbi:unnamed protein product [Arabidopsis halleri]
MCLTASVAPLWSFIKRVARHFQSVPTCGKEDSCILSRLCVFLNLRFD